MDGVPARRPRILVVDDEAYLVNAIRRTLRDAFVVAGATSCEEALAILEREAASFDAVFLDISFPLGGVQGDVALKTIVTRWPALTVMMLTADDDAMVAARCSAAGAITYLVKERLNRDLPRAASFVTRVTELRRMREYYVSRAQEIDAMIAALYKSGRADQSAALEVKTPERIAPLASVEKEHYRYALEQCGGNRREAARRLGIAYPTFLRRAREWGLGDPTDD